MGNNVDQASIRQVAASPPVGRLDCGLAADEWPTNPASILQPSYASERSPMHHKDPFDQLLIAQTQTEDMTLVSVDLLFSQYPVTVRG
jgi:hypothetical protein